MSFLNDTDHVKEQYQKPDGLSTRISIHEKYPTNKMGLSNWYFTVYKIEKGMKILELGCGTGSMWVNHKDVIAKCSQVVLSDVSEGMLATAKGNIDDMDNVSYEVIDIQDIPYGDGSFDVVIANYTLYHVPDIARALSEVSRVLKRGGCFYAGTTGENGIMETIMKYLNMEGAFKKTFSLDNGRKLLAPYFTSVGAKNYIDSLEVTDIDDLLEYIYSGITFCDYCKLPREEVKKILTGHMKDGVPTLPKESGIFVAIK